MGRMAHYDCEEEGSGLVKAPPEALPARLTGDPIRISKLTPCALKYYGTAKCRTRPLHMVFHDAAYTYLPGHN